MVTAKDWIRKVIANRHWVPVLNCDPILPFSPGKWEQSYQSECRLARHAVLATRPVTSPWKETLRRPRESLSSEKEGGKASSTLRPRVPNRERSSSILRLAVPRRLDRRTQWTLPRRDFSWFQRQEIVVVDDGAMFFSDGYNLLYSVSVFT